MTVNCAFILSFSKFIYNNNNCFKTKILKISEKFH